MNELLPKNWLTLAPDNIANLAPIQTLNLPSAISRGIKLSIKREDLLSAQFGGNKIYKLYGHLQAYLSQTQQNKQPPAIASFGGAYSNHLYALACVCQQLNIRFIAIIRGEKPTHLSPTLKDISAMGAQLHFVSRSDYKKKEEHTYRLQLEKQLGSCFWIPEGGGGPLSQPGCIALGKSIAMSSASHILHACGTGATLAGILTGISKTPSAANKPNVIGVSVLKSNASIIKNIISLTPPQYLKQRNWRLTNQFHHGGYAKKTKELDEMIERLFIHHHLPLDNVYTAKLVWATDQLLQNNVWREGEQVMLIHSGGLQGNRNTQKMENN